MSCCHDDPVYCCLWTASKTGSELMSCSEDSLVKWWDVRNLSQPTSVVNVQESGIFVVTFDVEYIFRVLVKVNTSAAP